MLDRVRVDPAYVSARQEDRTVLDARCEHLHLLEEAGIVHLHTAGRAKQPVVPYERIRIEVELGRPADRSESIEA